MIKRLKVKHWNEAAASVLFVLAGIPVCVAINVFLEPWVKGRVWLEVSVLMVVVAILQYIINVRYRHAIDTHRRLTHDAEQNYKLFFQNNPVPMWVYDLTTFRFLMVNNAAVARYGYTREEFLTMTIYDIRPQEDHALLTKNLTEDPNKGYIFSGVWRHRKKEGAVIYVEIDSHTIRYAGHDAKLVMAMDVTQLVSSQREIKIVSEELQNFVYRASHDLRGPLARIIGLTDLLQFDKDPESTVEYVRILGKTARLMDKMLARLLSVNNLRHYEPVVEEVHLRTFVNEIIAAAKDLNGADIHIENNIDAGLVLSTDAKIIRMALENIIDNAFKYRDPLRDPRIWIDASVKEGQVWIQVGDNGIGIAPDVKSRIFDLFFRGTELSNGSGLGLYIAQEALKLQQGKIELLEGAKNQTVLK